MPCFFYQHKFPSFSLLIMLLPMLSNCPFHYCILVQECIIKISFSSNISSLIHQLHNIPTEFDCFLETSWWYLNIDLRGSEKSWISRWFWDLAEPPLCFAHCVKQIPLFSKFFILFVYHFFGQKCLSKEVTALCELHSDRWRSRANYNWRLSQMTLQNIDMQVQNLNDNQWKWFLF